MAQTAKARLFSELSKSKQSTNYDETAYATATSTSFRDVIHSTPQRDFHEAQPRHDQSQDSLDGGSADMSIELGRGVKRGQRDEADDMSSNVMFGFGNDDSLYEVTGTPPIRTVRNGRKSEIPSRKHSAMRRATEMEHSNNNVAKQAMSGGKQRAVSDGLSRPRVDPEISQEARDFDLPTANLTFRNTRFVGSRQASANQPAHPTRFSTAQGLHGRDETPLRAANFNATIQSATFTANQSFMLPDLPNITELVSGVRKDATPSVNRSAKSRSRFTSASYRTQPQVHRTVDGLPLPEDEKAIFASLQMLKDRISQLEAENGEVQQLAEEYEMQIDGLQSQLRNRSMPENLQNDSDEDTALQRNPKHEKAKLEATLRGLQDRFERSERKISTVDNALKRVTKERDALIEQIGAAYFKIEQLSTENEDLRAARGDSHTEVEDLKRELELQKQENIQLREQLRKIPQQAASIPNLHRNPSSKSQSKKAAEQIPDASARVAQRRKSRDRMENNFALDMASRIEREVQKHREEAEAAVRKSQRVTEQIPRSRSKSRPRNGSSDDRRATRDAKPTIQHLPAPNDSESESTTEIQLTQKSQNTSLPRQMSSKTTDGLRNEQESRDITLLSMLDENLVANLRRNLEEEHRAKRAMRRTSAPVQGHTDRATDLGGFATSERKSSMKDLTSNRTSDMNLPKNMLDDSLKIPKSVRVLSPHTSDATAPPPGQQPTEMEMNDDSIMSNISRRRRRAASVEGMTSAFILPDITVRDNHHPATHADAKSCIPHDQARCTICAAADGTAMPGIPDPVPVHVRTDLAAAADDATDATVRPAQAPPLALATVIKHLEDEITHLKLQRDAHNTRYNRHDPARAKTARMRTKARLDRLTAEIERRSDQVYALYDVLEGQRSPLRHEDPTAAEVPMTEEEVEQTLTSVGIDPAELSGRVGRKAPQAAGALDGIYEFSDASVELPWEGLSEGESEIGI